MPGGPIFLVNLPSAMVTNIQGNWVIELGLSMSTLQKRSSAALETCLLILLRNARDLELQLHELKKLRYQVWEAELSAQKSRRTDNGIRDA
jgi:hypothetical protein